MVKTRLLPSVSLRLMLALMSVVLALGIFPTSPLAAQGSTPGRPFYPNSAGNIPLRVMVPAPHVARQLADQNLSMTQLFPRLDPIRSFSPGIRPNAVGTFRALAILVEFSDNQHDAGVSPTTYDNLLFNTTSGSVRHFYSQNSYNQLDIVNFDLPSTLGWTTAPHPYSYYVNNAYCGIYTQQDTYPRNCQRMAEDVVTAVAAAHPELDWSLYDNDNDGYVDTIFIIHAGQGAEYSLNHPASKIWSHSWSTTLAFQNDPANLLKFNNKKIGSYTTEPEYWGMPGDMTFGVFAHEFGHVLGLPDLYDIGDTNIAGVGNWSLMGTGSWNGFSSTGGDSPAHFDAWSRIFLGFADSTLIPPGTTQMINLPDVESNSTNAIFRINTKKPNEYFLLENRQKMFNTYDFGLPGAGLLIWHVDGNIAGSPNEYACTQVNNWLCQTRHFSVALEQADGLHQLELRPPTTQYPTYIGNRGDAGDVFPGSTGKRLFNFTTNPNSSSYYSSLNQGIGISNISDSQPTMSMFVDTIVPDPVNAAPVRNFFTIDTPILTWNAVNGAVRYQVQIDRLTTFNSPAIISTFTTSLNYTTPTLGEGIWYWRVRACATTTTCTGTFSPADTLYIKTS